MSTGKGQVLELILEDGCRQVRVSCPLNLIPSPGQYLLASDTSDAPLPVPLFYTDSAPQSFTRRTAGTLVHGTAGTLVHRTASTLVAAASVPDSWNPGLELHLRGPLGRGFTLPISARKVGLVAFDASPARLKGLIRPALKQDAAVVLVCDSSPDNLPDDVEVQPMSALHEIVDWADYLAFDVARENLNQMREQLGKLNQFAAAKAGVAKSSQRELSRNEAQVFVHTPVPCGGVAECGVCAVTLKSYWKLACKDGPVFDWKDIFE
jgi:NAD(P)H-flavin reductase